MNSTKQDIGLWRISQGLSELAGSSMSGTRGSTLLVGVEDVVLRLHGHMARVSAI